MLDIVGALQKTSFSCESCCSPPGHVSKFPTPRNFPKRSFPRTPNAFFQTFARHYWNPEIKQCLYVSFCVASERSYFGSVGYEIGTDSHCPPLTKSKLSLPVRSYFRLPVQALISRAPPVYYMYIYKERGREIPLGKSKNGDG